jgi:hypothetical protein
MRINLSFALHFVAFLLFLLAALDSFESHNIRRVRLIAGGLTFLTLAQLL